MTNTQQQTDAEMIRASVQQDREKYYYAKLHQMRLNQLDALVDALEWYANGLYSAWKAKETLAAVRKMQEVDDE